MESERFDALVRAWGEGDASRRHALRALGALLASGALGGMATRLGWVEDADAKAKQRHTRRRHPQPSRQPQAAGRKQKKRKHKNRHKNKNKPKPPKPQLCDLLCIDDGGRCCKDGSCVDKDACCPDERTCSLGPMGDYCIPRDGCCIEEQPCEDGTCVPPGQCCPGWRRCKNNTCVKPNDIFCCKEDRICANGACVGQDECCPDEKKCASGGCVSKTLCCLEDQFPSCSDCEHVVCQNGKWECQSICQGADAVCCGGECLSPCGNGCDISDDCSCTKAPAGKAYCPAQGRCVSTECPAGKEFDSTLCRCIEVFCSTNSETCPIDWSTNTCGGPRNFCHCLKSVSGDIHCVDHYWNVDVFCGKDSDCDKWYGEPGQGMCSACTFRCYRKGCTQIIYP